MPRIPWKPCRSKSEKKEEESSGPCRRLADTKAGRGTGAVMSKPPFAAAQQAFKAHADAEPQVFFADEEACRSLEVASAPSLQGPGGRRGVVLRKPKLPLRPKSPHAANQHLVSEMLGARTGGAGIARAVVGKSSGQWCFWQHCRSFNESLHGFLMVKGQLVYQFPDGRTVLVGEVSSITKDGELVQEAGAV